jgi:hypothetical protein
VSLPLGGRKIEVYNILNKMSYPYQEMESQAVSHSIGETLMDDEISTLEYWRKSMPMIKSLIQSECVGCSDTVSKFKPVYKVHKGKYVHFGFKNEMGVENWVFKKNGAFKARLYSFQGESKEEIKKALKDIQDIDYVLQGVYPVKIDNSSIYLKHVEFEYPSELNESWYRPMFPTTIKYQIDLNEKSPILRFKLEGGLYSFQKPDENGTYRIINFVEPLFYANAVDLDEPMSYSSFTDAFYANATFFIMDLEDDAHVSIRIESKNIGNDFKFSLFNNDGFYTIEDYLQKEHPSFQQVKRKIKKGRYLIRVLHKNADYAENPLYTIYIDKEIVKSMQVIDTN